MGFIRKKSNCQIISKRSVGKLKEGKESAGADKQCCYN